MEPNNYDVIITCGSKVLPSHVQSHIKGRLFCVAMTPVHFRSIFAGPLTELLESSLAVTTNQQLTHLCVTHYVYVA